MFETPCCETVKLYIYKVDSTTGVRLAGAVFTLTSASGQNQTVTTPFDGVASVELRQCNEYTLTETQPPAEYAANTQVYQIRVNRSGEIYVNGERQACLTVFNTPLNADLTIIYNPNGGTGGSTEAAVDGAPYLIKTSTAVGVVRPGYIFMNWNTQADGSGSIYQPGQMITASGNITLYAQWTMVR